MICWRHSSAQDHTEVFRPQRTIQKMNLINIDTVQVGQQLVGIDIPVHSGAHICHDFPIRRISAQCRDKGPLTTHMRLDRMDGAVAVPEDTVPVEALGQNPTWAGSNTVSCLHLLRRKIQELSNGGNVLIGYIGTAETLATGPALGAGEKVFRIHLFISPGDNPKHTSGSFCRQTASHRRWEPRRQFG